MKKNQIRLILSLTVFIGLLVVVIIMMRNKSNSTFKKELSNFAIEDTASISKFVITNQDKKSVTLTRKSPDHWELDGKYRARIESVYLILEVCKKIEVKSPVPESARKNVLRNMAVEYFKAEFYGANDQLIKTWYVGYPTKDHDASYMILETPEEGKSDLPYITYIPGFHGQLTSRFYIDPLAWRFTGVFNYDPAEIASVSMTNNDSIHESFEVKVTGENEFQLIDFMNRKVPVFDTAAVRQFVVNFKKIHFETFNKGILSPLQEDSLRHAKPYYIVQVKTKKGESKKLNIYHKKVPPKNSVGNENTGEYPWDPERAFALLPDGQIVVIQFFVFDKILWPIYAFTHSTRLQN
ncbi:MAG: hypothetical protein K1X56_01810 [Flavobacteriales bacterium]|nr:hypothetical protein [Flavobacteriales bacterium]